MKIAIISDIHNNETNLKKVLDFCGREKIEKIICCGDLASLETLDFLCDNFSGEIFYTFGNMDNDQMNTLICHPELDSGSNSNCNETTKLPLDSGSKSGMTYNYKNTKIYKNFGETEIDGKKIAFVHFPDKAKSLAETGKYAFVFYGHTHKPWMEVIELPASAKASARRCTMLNPGNVTGDFYPPTFAIWNTIDDKFELIRIHNLK